MKLKYSLYIAVALTACNSKPGAEATADAEPNPHEISLSDSQLVASGIETSVPQLISLSAEVRCNGSIEAPPQNRFAVTAKTGAFVKEMHFYTGDQVRKGDLLCVLEHQEIITLQRDYLDCLAKMKFLERERDRKKELAAQDAVAVRSSEQAEADFQSEKSRKQSLEAELELIGISPSAVTKSGIRKSISVYSPANGTVGAINIQPGKFVSPNEMMYEIIDGSHLHLELAVFGKDLGNVQKEDEVTFYVPGKKDSYKAHVHLLGPSVDMTTKTANVHAHLAQNYAGLRPGMFVEATIACSAKKVAAVPETAVILEGNKQYVFVRSGNKFIKTEAETGLRSGGMVELKSIGGTAPTIAVVTKGVQSLLSAEE